MIDYTVASKTYDNTRESDDIIIEIMFEKGVFEKNNNILDFGCGTGNYLYKISQKYQCNCYGLEPSIGMRQKSIEKNPNLVIVEGNHNNIPFDNDFFNYIYMTDVIHHVPELNILFNTFSKKIKQNGYVSILTQSWKQIENRWYNKYFPSLESIEKNRYPDIEKIIETSKQNGFRLEIIDVKENPVENIVDEHFIKLVEEKNYSMFRLLENKEYKNGLNQLRKEIHKKIISRNAGESLIWLKK